LKAATKDAASYLAGPRVCVADGEGIPIWDNARPSYIGNKSEGHMGWASYSLATGGTETY